MENKKKYYDSGLSCEEQKALLRQLRAEKFALIEVKLFLDSHPDDKKALAFYKEHEELYRHLKKRWEKETCEKLSDDGSRWTWVDTPWPWQSWM